MSDRQTAVPVLPTVCTAWSVKCVARPTGHVGRAARGRPPASQLNAEIEAYTEERAIGLMIAGNGDYGADEFGCLPALQRAGDAVLTSPVLGIAHSRANTLSDSVP